MNVGDRVRFERKRLWPGDPAVGTGMVIGFMGPNVIVEVDDPDKTTIIGPPTKFRRAVEYRTQQPDER